MGRQKSLSRPWHYRRELRMVMRVSVIPGLEKMYEERGGKGESSSPYTNHGDKRASAILQLYREGILGVEGSHAKQKAGFVGENY